MQITLNIFCAMLGVLGGAFALAIEARRGRFPNTTAGFLAILGTGGFAGLLAGAICKAVTLPATHEMVQESRPWSITMVLTIMVIVVAVAILAACGAARVYFRRRINRSDAFRVAVR